MDKRRLVQFHLPNWRRWMQPGDSRLGYAKSHVFSTGGESTSGEFDRLCGEVDRNCAIKLDTLIYSMEKRLYEAIEVAWLDHKGSRHYYDEALEELLLLATKADMI